jgi:hypothetical protein
MKLPKKFLIGMLRKELLTARRDLREIITAVSLSEFLPGDAHEWLQSHPENAPISGGIPSAASDCSNSEKP